MDINCLHGIIGRDLKVLDYNTDKELGKYLEKQGSLVSFFEGTQESELDTDYDVIIYFEKDIDVIKRLTARLKVFGKLIIDIDERDIEIQGYIQNFYNKIREGQYVKTNLNIMMIYNYNEGTTGDFLERAFKHYARVMRPNIKPNGEGIRTLVKQYKIDLILQVDSGGWVRIPPDIGCKTACYSIDTFNNTEKIFDIIKNYDYKFFAQKRFAQKDKEYWLPLGADTDVYKPVNTTLEHDISFCGTFLVKKSQADRNKYLKTLVNEAYKGGLNFYLGRDYNEHACLKYNQSRLVFNMGIANDINMRFFEVMACGIPQLYNHVDGIEELGFKADEHYLSFENEKEMIKKMWLAINYPDKLKDMVEKSFYLVMNNHTYKHRIEQLIKIVFK